jgi:hypothetical protein
MLVEEADADLDDFAVCQNDCADGDPSRHPGALEACNGLDDDCDDMVPEDELDLDSDGWAVCAGDCNDGAAEIHPAALELCRNLLDDDCDDSIDGEEGYCLAGICAVTALGAPGSDPALSFDQAGVCPVGAPLPRAVEVVWGDLAAISAGVGQVDLGVVNPAACDPTAEGCLYDSLRPDPGSVDFVLVREAGASHFGYSSAGEPRVADPGPGK